MCHIECLRVLRTEYRDLQAIWRKVCVYICLPICTYMHTHVYSYRACDHLRLDETLSQFLSNTYLTSSAAVRYSYLVKSKAGAVPSFYDLCPSNGYLHSTQHPGPGTAIR